MAHWMLAPIDHRAEIWRTYPVQRIVVEAPDEAGARAADRGGARSSAAESLSRSCPDLLRRSQSWRDDEHAMIAETRARYVEASGEKSRPVGWCRPVEGGGGDRGGFWLGHGQETNAR
jgi:hypothetical protein